MKYWAIWHLEEDGEVITEGVQTNETNQENVLVDTSSTESTTDFTEINQRLDDLLIINMATSLLIGLLVAYLIFRDLLGGTK